MPVVIMHFSSPTIFSLLLLLSPCACMSARRSSLQQGRSTYINGGRYDPTACQLVLHNLETWESGNWKVTVQNFGPNSGSSGISFIEMFTTSEAEVEILWGSRTNLKKCFLLSRKRLLTNFVAKKL